MSINSDAAHQNEVPIIHNTAETKALLRLAVERKRGSATSMVKAPVQDYAKAHGPHVAKTEILVLLKEVTP